MMPIRANIVGQPVSATRISASIRGLPRWMLVLGFRQLCDVVGRVLER